MLLGEGGIKEIRVLEGDARVCVFLNVLGVMIVVGEKVV